MWEYPPLPWASAMEYLIGQGVYQTEIISCQMHLTLTYQWQNRVFLWSPIREILKCPPLPSLQPTLYI